MTFKIGDKVRVKLDGSHYTRNSECGWEKQMDKTLGKTGVIAATNENTSWVCFEEMGLWWYHNDSLQIFINEDRQMEATKLKLELGETYVEENGGLFIIVSDCRIFFNCDSYPFIAYYYNNIYQFSEEGISKCGQLQLIKKYREPIKNKKTFWVLFNPKSKSDNSYPIDQLTGLDTDDTLYEEKEEALRSVNKFQSCLAKVEVTVTEEPVENEKETTRSNSSTQVDLPRTAPHYFRIDLGEA